MLYHKHAVRVQRVSALTAMWSTCYKKNANQVIAFSLCKFELHVQKWHSMTVATCCSVVFGKIKVAGCIKVTSWEPDRGFQYRLQTSALVNIHSALMKKKNPLILQHPKNSLCVHRWWEIDSDVISQGEKSGECTHHSYETPCRVKGGRDCG